MAEEIKQHEERPEVAREVEEDVLLLNAKKYFSDFQMGGRA